jgi:hypothetical protein
MFRQKFWEEADNILTILLGKNADCVQKNVYYGGGTLFIDFNSDRAIALNLNGKGFVMNDKMNPEHNTLIYQPDYIFAKTKALYVKTKGETTHYKNEMKRLEKQQ